MAVPRIIVGSKEFLAHNVIVDGVAVTSGYEYADVVMGQPVVTWLTALTLLDGKSGHLIGPGTAHVNPAGVREVFVRVVDSPETPVRKVGEYRLV